MKKMTLFLMALSMVCCGTSFARTDLEKSKVAVLKQGELVRLCYEGHASSKVEISIKDSEGHEIFSEEIKEESFIRPYNFSNLPSGCYEMIVRDETGEHKEKIKYYDRTYLGHVALLKGKEKENKYLVTIPKHENSEVTICVFDKENRMVFSDVAKKGEDYAKVYHLKDLEGASIQLFNRD